MNKWLLNVWLSLRISLLFLTSASFAPGSSAVNRVSATEKHIPNPSDSSEIAWRQGQAIADDATSGFNSLRPYPGISVPDNVVRYLVHDRHGIDYHLPLSVLPEQHQILDAKVHEALYDFEGNTPVSPFTYEGETYFLFPVSDLPNSDYPRWSRLLQEPAGIKRRDVRPFFLAKLTPNSSNRKYELMAVRTTATAEDTSYFVDSLKSVHRKLMTFSDLLSSAIRAAARGH